MLQEKTKPQVFGYRYGDGRDFKKSGDAIRQLQKDAQKSEKNLLAHKIVINDERQFVSLAL